MEVFELQGGYSSVAATDASAVPSTARSLFRRLLLQRSVRLSFDITADAPVTVPFGDLASVGALVIEPSSKVRVRVTSADGTQQSFPVDDLLVLVARSVGITAIDLARVAGVETTVQVFLGATA